MSDDLTRASKFLAYVLRHDPAAIGLTLDHGGWARIDALLSSAARHGRDLDAATLDRVLRAPGKQRFETRDGLIRAAQGHSVHIDLGLEPRQPPPVLYHGTVARFLDSIGSHGLRPGSRTHVHLSASTDTAATVGARRGRPVVLHIDSAAMSAGGHQFFQAANGVWLTAHVPAAFISIPSAKHRTDRSQRRPEAREEPGPMTADEQVDVPSVSQCGGFAGLSPCRGSLTGSRGIGVPGVG